MLSIRSYIYYGLGRRAVMASEATNGHVSHPRSDGVDGSDLKSTGGPLSLVAAVCLVALE